MPAQVLDISKSEQHPDKVLKALYRNLDAAAAKGDKQAEDIKKCAIADCTALMSHEYHVGVSPSSTAGRGHEATLHGSWQRILHDMQKL